MRLIRPFESTESRLQLCFTRLLFKGLSFPEEDSARGLGSCRWPQPHTAPRYYRCSSVTSISNSRQLQISGATNYLGDIMEQLHFNFIFFPHDWDCFEEEHFLFSNILLTTCASALVYISDWLCKLQCTQRLRCP